MKRCPSRNSKPDRWYSSGFTNWTTWNVTQPGISHYRILEVYNCCARWNIFLWTLTLVANKKLKRIQQWWNWKSLCAILEHSVDFSHILHSIFQILTGWIALSQDNSVQDDTQILVIGTAHCYSTNWSTWCNTQPRPSQYSILARLRIQQCSSSNSNLGHSYSAPKFYQLNNLEVTQPGISHCHTLARIPT